jgi:caspase domain-containing protein
MTNFAIVIGIDRYDNPELRLSGAVNDALDFADWAQAKGDVPPQHLRLLLSPETPVGRAHSPADAQTIHQVIADVQNGAAAGAGRLYFYYAGHGVSAPGVASSGVQEPVLVPSDMRDWQVDKYRLIGFSEVISVLRTFLPAEQFYFIDACRDFALDNLYLPAVGQATGAWLPRQDGRVSLSQQLILYAASPGQRAAEDRDRRQGVFTPALLEGLRGAATALNWSSASNRYEVKFSTLTEHVKKSVRRRLNRRPGASAFVQEPQAPVTGDEDAVVASFSTTEVDKIDVAIRVSPKLAHEGGLIKVLYQLPQQEAVVWSTGPPLEATSTVKLAPFDYTFTAEAPDFIPVRSICSVYEPAAVELYLGGRPRSGSDGDAPRADEPSGADSGRLTVSVPDETAAIAVWNSEREQVAVAAGWLDRALPPGLYRVRLLLPEGPGAERLVEVSPGRTTSVSLDAPVPALEDRPRELLQQHGISPDEHGFITPSGLLGPLAQPSLASLLAFAAYAANAPEWEALNRLRGLGVTTVSRLPREPGETSSLLVLAGSNREGGASLADARLTVYDPDGPGTDRGMFEVLPAFPVAAQRGLVRTPGAAHIEIRVPGHQPTRYAVTCLPDRITVLVAVLQADNRAEVQQYLFPAPDKAAGLLGTTANHIRRLELAQRSYSAGTPFSRTELTDLLYGKWLDPLMSCLAGYTLVRRGETEEFASVALPNMQTYFAGLPDTHVLAALSSRGRERDAHFERALSTGVPTFTEGFRALYDWLRRSRSSSSSLTQIAPVLVPGSPWTAWVTAPPTE